MQQFMKYFELVTKIIKKQKRLFIIGGCVLVVLLLLGSNAYLYTKLSTVTSVPIEPVTVQAESKNAAKVYVDIKGAVQKPGVYEGTEGERIVDIIRRAGGLTFEADTSLINQSKLIEDQMVIIVYTKEEMRKLINTNTGRLISDECVCPELLNDACLIDSNNPGTSNNQNSNNTTTGNNNPGINGLININTATAQELQQLPGIGEARANDIVNFRRDNQFITIDDIKKVSGIGDAIFARIKDLITV